MFKGQGYQVEHFTKAWTEEELLAKIGDYHAIGIRSKTKITENVIKAATKVRRPSSLPSPFLFFFSMRLGLDPETSSLF